MCYYIIKERETVIKEREEIEMTRKQKAALKNFLLEATFFIGLGVTFALFIIGACEGWW